MLMSSKFKSMINSTGALEIGRAGVAKKFIVPLAVQNNYTYDANVDENNNILVSEGNSIYILADEFGFLGGHDESTQVEANIFFVDEGIVFELVEGRLVLKGENGEAYTVDETGEIDYPRSNAPIHWSSAKDIRGIVSTVAKYRYSTSHEVVQGYIDNLVLNMTLHYVNTAKGYMFKTQVIEYFEDLGLGIFPFIDYSSREFESDDDDDFVDVSDLEDIDDEEEEEEEYDMGEDEDYKDAF